MSLNLFLFIFFIFIGEAQPFQRILPPYYVHQLQKNYFNLYNHQIPIESEELIQVPIEEIQRRRNFAIISHPDAGKTTLTEKLLLFGGAIQDAGAVKARADQRKVTSDWMEIEKQRGISVTSTVLTFEYPFKNRNYHINLLDTPGHQDFSEDTYRTLSAADNSLMLIDGAKGVEDRTRKLFDVCKLRSLPMFIFVNKMDRPSMTPFEIIDQLEQEFKFQCCPMNWPIGNGPDFQGVYDRKEKVIHLYEKGNRKKKTKSVKLLLDDPELPSIIGKEEHEKLLEDIEFLNEILVPLNQTMIETGEQAPLFFGSAMNNFGVELFLQTFINLALPPTGKKAIIETEGNKKQDVVSPSYEGFSGFIFKLQANLDPKHRDRMAFVRICSGVYQKGMKISHSRLKKTINLSTAQSLFAQDRESIITAYPGDIIGIHNPGHFAIGDTIFSGNKKITYPGIPSFSPECFAYIRSNNPSAYKKFQKGLSELLDEGAVQLLLEREDTGYSNSILAGVGQLQLEVVDYRLRAEYNVEVKLDPLTYTAARWVNKGWSEVDKIDALGKLHGVFKCKDRWERPVLLFRNPWKIKQLEEEHPELELALWTMPPSD